MNVTFFFDPTCPWCWITSRWLIDVSKDRDLEVTFKSFSLAIKNNYLNEVSDSEYAPQSILGHKLLRVIESVRKTNGDDAVSKLYSEFGKKIHIEGKQNIDWVNDVLEAQKLDSSHANALEDETFDKIIASSMDEAFEVCGNDIGVPIIKTETKDGPRGFFGPVISVLPEHDEGLALWDGIASMISFPNFFELKRTRDIGPDTQSTAKLFGIEAINDENQSAQGDACSIF